ncbi:M24 family metallopeptidase [Polaribacter cellanae]|uniref:Aminopeptidase P family protein n=1 Tax=Polaribacter cellanae TaxID=2818493 RepID=A0A975H7N7_9FLAO|nr:Xaa-Pro peptidase family protein [Polaribacter cellanae]QTE23701.1 aminopeptidase P family protein [Polaribacter cellanae]
MKTFGIGGSTIEAELAAIQPLKTTVKPIQKEEYKKRIQKLAGLMKTNNVQAVYVNAGTNLLYFTGTHWHASERMVGAIILQNEEVHYIAPNFEKGTIEDFLEIEGTIHCWEEHECPYKLFLQVLDENEIDEGEIQLDETTPFSIVDGLYKEIHPFYIEKATDLISECRMIKSDAEIAIMQHVMDITLEVQKAAARILREGITTKEVENFIHEAHKKYGVSSGSYFCIVLFGVDSSFPHGVKNPKKLEKNDMVLVDTGCQLYDYISDITRTYVFGKANDLQRNIWNIEKETQLAAFNASILGNTCGSVDDVSRETLEKNGLGPDYNLPGLPHRTGHGIGLDIHEYPYIVRGNKTKLVSGMTLSNEPMICVPNEFGVRLEDHIYMTGEGAKWFTEPAHSIENPFGV